MRKRAYKIAGWEIRFSGIRFRGLNRLYFSSIHMNKGGHTSFHIQGLHLIISIPALLKTFNLYKSIACLNADKIHITPVAGKSNGLNGITGNKDKSFKVPDWETKLYPKVLRLLDSIPRIVSINVEVREMILNMNLADADCCIAIENFKSSKNLLSGNCIINYKKFTGCFSFSAKLNDQRKSFDLHGSHIRVSNQGADILSIEECTISGSQKRHLTFTELIFSLSLNRTQINHKVFSLVPANIEDIEAEITLEAGYDKFEICRGTTVAINDIPVSLHVLHEVKDADLIQSSLIFIIEGKTFFKSYPFFNVGPLANVKAEGEIVVQLDYMVQLTDLSWYYFNATIVKDTLQIIDFGLFPLSSGFKDRGFIGECLHDINHFNSNADYVKKEAIPEHLLAVVIMAEDPNFYSHSGIDPYFVGVATAINLMNRRFKKGASTLTMQLSRNLFLYNEKSISRKLEEMVVAWLLENHLKLSKEQILELYLNIIEFGNGLYGIKQAAKYYFNKEVACLSLVECITISYIIPRPKHFLDALLIKSPQLLTNLKKHIDLYSLQLWEAGKITRKDLEEIGHVVEFDINSLVKKKIALKWDVSQTN